MRVQGVPRSSLGIAILCVLGYLAMLFIGDGVFARFGMIPAKGILQLGALTSLFVHIGLLHLLGNLVFFYLSGPVVEDAWGVRLFLVLYFAGGLVADLGQILLDPSSEVPVVGASGAIAACMGALCIQFPRRKVRMFYWVFPIFKGTFFMPVWLWGGLWFVLEIFDLLTAGDGAGVAFGAHLAGFLFGVTMGVVVLKLRGEPSGLQSAPSIPTTPKRPAVPVIEPSAPPTPPRPPVAPPISAAAPIAPAAVSIEPPQEPAPPIPAQPDAPKPKPRPFPKAPRLRSDHE